MFWQYLQYHAPCGILGRPTHSAAVTKRHPDDFFDPVALKASLSQALVEFYPLAGRLRRDVNGRIEIDCNGEGAFFAEAECDGALADFGDFILPEINLVPQADYSGGISTYPLLLVQSQEDEGSTVKYTTYQSLAGHIWRCATKARKLPKDQETKLYIPMEGRTRLQPPLPAGYFGNVVGRVAATAFCGEVESNPLKFSVGKVHEAMAEMGSDYLRSAIDYLEVHAGGTASYKCPNLGVVSWAKFGIFRTDFGWGTPIRLGINSPPPEGNIIVLSTLENDGSLLVAVVLLEKQMLDFENFFYQI